MYMYKATRKINHNDQFHISLGVWRDSSWSSSAQTKENGGITENENMMKDCAHSYLCIPAKCAAVGS